jgi:hypothetical protein
MKVLPQAVKEVTKQKPKPPLPLKMEPPSEEEGTKMTCFKLATIIQLRLMQGCLAGLFTMVELLANTIVAHNIEILK